MHTLTRIDGMKFERDISYTAKTLEEAKEILNTWSLTVPNNTSHRVKITTNYSIRVMNLLHHGKNDDNFLLFFGGTPEEIYSKIIELCNTVKK